MQNEELSTNVEISIPDGSNIILNATGTEAAIKLTESLLELIKTLGEKTKIHKDEDDKSI
jgi:hypothetical protein